MQNSLTQFLTCSLTLENLPLSKYLCNPYFNAILEVLGPDTRWSPVPSGHRFESRQRLANASTALSFKCHSVTKQSPKCQFLRQYWAEHSLPINCSPCLQRQRYCKQPLSWYRITVTEWVAFIVNNSTTERPLFKSLTIPRLLFTILTAGPFSNYPTALRETDLTVMAATTRL